MEPANLWPTNEELLPMVSTDNIANEIFDTSPTECVSTWDPDNNDWKGDADWRLFGSDVPTIEPLSRPPLEGLPTQAGPSSSLSPYDPSTAIVLDSNAQMASNAPGSAVRTLALRPTDPTGIPNWGQAQTQPLPHQRFPGSTTNGLLIQFPFMEDPQMMHDGGIGLAIYNEQPQIGPGVAWNDNAAAFNALQHQQPPVISKLECDSPTDADDEAGDAGDRSYAKLLYECLLNAPGHMLPLKDIYAWMQQSTSKARDPNSKGWQNSVRHNLSMNQVSVSRYLFDDMLLTVPGVRKSAIERRPWFKEGRRWALASFGGSAAQGRDHLDDKIQKGAQEETGPPNRSTASTKASSVWCERRTSNSRWS
jgi:hypothetical protein